MAKAETVNMLYEAMLAALDEVSQTTAFSRGEAMSALVRLLVSTGLCEPQDTAERLIFETNETMTHAIKEYRAAVQ